ncbi:MAG TPA: type II toxin-antitoxin system PemK/MazF family toxin [Rhizomicrobium sp.]|jgi:mRNA interferase MazF
MAADVKRGDVWTVSGSGDYDGKTRPAVIVQDDNFDGTESITLCVFTSDATDAPLFRLPIEPNATNGLRLTSRLMVDKITTVSKKRLGERIGRLADEDMVRLNRAMMVFLGITTAREKR